MIVQDDRFDQTDSLTICPLTSEQSDAVFLRVVIEPSPLNGLDSPSSVMVDKITTVRRDRIGSHIGQLTRTEVVELNRAAIVFLGLTLAPRATSTDS